jgi:hypothetical protein
VQQIYDFACTASECTLTQERFTTRKLKTPGHDIQVQHATHNATERSACLVQDLWQAPSTSDACVLVSIQMAVSKQILVHACHIVLHESNSARARHKAL